MISEIIDDHHLEVKSLLTAIRGTINLFNHRGTVLENIVDPYEMDRSERSHYDLHCLLLSSVHTQNFCNGWIDLELNMYYSVLEIG